MAEQYVIFRLAGETYGVRIENVREIIVYQKITRVPRAPDFVEGVINLRGRVIPVIDLRRRFGLEVAEVTRDTRIVVAELDDLTVGLTVDSVSEVLRLSEDQMEAASPVVAGVDSEFISSIANLEDRLIVILDLARVLNQKEKESLSDTALTGTV